MMKSGRMSRGSAAILVCLAGLSSLPAQARDKFRIASDYSAFYRTEPVSFAVFNDGSKPLCFPNNAPWQVRSDAGLVYTPIAVQGKTCVASGQALRWVWDQRDNSGNFVAPGDYVIAVGSSQQLPFLISELQGSAGHFTFEVGEETVRVFMANPRAIRAAIERYYGLNFKHPSGRVVDDRPGKSPYDNQWSWHLEPASVAMADFSATVCHAMPSAVESDLGFWANKSWCFMGAEITGLE